MNKLFCMFRIPASQLEYTIINVIILKYSHQDISKIVGVHHNTITKIKKLGLPNNAR